VQRLAIARTAGSVIEERLVLLVTVIVATVVIIIVELLQLEHFMSWRDLLHDTFLLKQAIPRHRARTCAAGLFCQCAHTETQPGP